MKSSLFKCLQAGLLLGNFTSASTMSSGLTKGRNILVCWLRPCQRQHSTGVLGVLGYLKEGLELEPLLAQDCQVVQQLTPHLCQPHALRGRQIQRALRTHTKTRSRSQKLHRKSGDRCRSYEQRSSFARILWTASIKCGRLVRSEDMGLNESALWVRGWGWPWVSVTVM